MRRSPAARLLLAVGSFSTIVVLGTVGYMLLGDASLMDALHMTVTTVTAVGYREVVRLEGTARLFTLLVIVLGVGSITFVVVSGLDFVVEGHLEELLGRRRMDRELARLEHHTVVCGFGQVGRHVAQRLREEGRPLVVVDIDRDRVAAARGLGLLAVEGDATLEETLEHVRSRLAHAVIASAHHDADNVLISLTVRGISPDAYVIARVKQDENEAKVRRAGADRVIAPAAIGGNRIAALVTRPGVIDFLDVVTHGAQQDLMLEQLLVRRGDELDGRTLRDLQLRERLGITVLSIKAGDGAADTRPGPESVLRAGDALVVLGDRKALRELRG